MSSEIVNTHEAKSRLSELIREAEEGSDVIIARNGRPVAKIIPWPPARAAREPGTWADRIEFIGDEVGPDEEVARVFDDSADAGMP
jgi:prevent-host-death family protein